MKRIFFVLFICFFFLGCENQNINVKSDKLALGWNHSCQIRDDNKLYCWGDNSNGQLGDSTTELKNEPVKIGDDEWLSIGAGGDYTCGIKSDYKLYCFSKILGL